MHSIPDPGIEITREQRELRNQYNQVLAQLDPDTVVRKVLPLIDKLAYGDHEEAAVELITLLVERGILDGDRPMESCPAERRLPSPLNPNRTYTEPCLYGPGHGGIHSYQRHDAD